MDIDKDIIGNADESTDMIHDSKPQKITAEIIMTSGPRKENDNKDRELGEDAAGVVLMQDTSFFWIADGTSECNIVKNSAGRCIFSSRILAQDIGTFIRVKINSCKKNVSMHEICINVLTDIETTWNDKLCEFLKEESNKKILDGIFGNSLSIDISSTLLCGLLDNKGKFNAAWIGDSRVIVKNDNRFHDFREEIRPSRLYMRLNKHVGNNDSFNFSCHGTNLVESKKLSGVTVVIAGSDGIGMLLAFIKNRGDQGISLKEIRKGIHKFIPNAHDDKTLCIISREEY